MTRFRAAVDVDVAYGARIERVVLFGSRAGGDAQPDSDYDVAMFLRGPVDFGAESRIVSEIEIDLMSATGAVVNSLSLREGSYGERTGFMAELRRDGVDL